MCEQSGTHQQGPFNLDEDQNHVFQKHIVVTYSAIVCLSLGPHFSLKGVFISVYDTKRNKLY